MDPVTIVFGVCIPRPEWLVNVGDIVLASNNAAMDRSLELLKSWLTPEQLQQFEDHGYFDVIGNASGKTYRIDSSLPTFNVHLFNADGTLRERYCIVPEGTAWTGDRLLAQKIAFETDEENALKTANRYGAHGWYG